jgi:hypothetical protein
MLPEVGRGLVAPSPIDGGAIPDVVYRTNTERLDALPTWVT